MTLTLMISSYFLNILNGWSSWLIDQVSGSHSPSIRIYAASLQTKRIRSLRVPVNHFAHLRIINNMSRSYQHILGTPRNILGVGPCSVKSTATRMAKCQRLYVARFDYLTIHNERQRIFQRNCKLDKWIDTSSSYNLIELDYNIKEVS